MGDDDDDGINAGQRILFSNSNHFHQYQHQKATRTTDKKSSSYTPAASFSWHRICLPLLYFTAILSYSSSTRTQNQLLSTTDRLLSERDWWQGRQFETLQLQQELLEKRDSLQKRHKESIETQDRLHHEWRMKEEMMERVTGENRALLMATLAKQQAASAMTWIQKRQEALYHKIQILQEHIQQHISRPQVLEKYGPGPHRVEFTVQIMPKEEPEDISNDNNKKKKRQPKTMSRTRTFVVQLAPLDQMPHAIETFLDMIVSKPGQQHQPLWDNTVFYHHAKQDHVIAAAPVQYGTFESKFYHFQALGYEGVVFPEYSKDLPHEEYTIGFSGKGPNFYINTMDNSEHHGPGGQNHHDLAQDADPCFGTIVRGKQVIQDMLTMKKRTNKDSITNAGAGEGPASWKDYDLTQIVKVRLL